jgi:hypothetical protein
MTMQLTWAESNAGLAGSGGSQALHAGVARARCGTGRGAERGGGYLQHHHALLHAACRR